MDEKLISMLIGGAGAGGTVVSGIFVWWLKGAIGDLRKITLLVKNFENLKASIDSMSGKLDAMNTMIHQNNKEIAVLERDVATQWKRYDDVSKYIRDKGL